MNTLEYRIASAGDIEMFMDIRLEMLRAVNSLPDGYEFSEELIYHTRRYFLDGDQTTVLALDNGRAVGCASLCCIGIMPTFSHPTGRRAYLMNVYTNAACRRQGIARKMVEILIDEAQKRGVTEISLDATRSGRPLYEALGFTASEECMVKLIGRKEND